MPTSQPRGGGTTTRRRLGRGRSLGTRRWDGQRGQRRLAGFSPADRRDPGRGRRHRLFLDGHRRRQGPMVAMHDPTKASPGGKERVTGAPPASDVAVLVTSAWEESALDGCAATAAGPQRGCNQRHGHPLSGRAWVRCIVGERRPVTAASQPARSGRAPAGRRARSSPPARSWRRPGGPAGRLPSGR